MGSTAQKEIVTGKKVTATMLKLGTYALSWSFSHARHIHYVRVAILQPPSPSCTGHRFDAVQWPLKTLASRLVLFVV